MWVELCAELVGGAGAMPSTQKMVLELSSSAYGTYTKGQGFDPLRAEEYGL